MLWKLLGSLHICTGFQIYSYNFRQASEEVMPAGKAVDCTGSAHSGANTIDNQCDLPVHGTSDRSDSEDGAPCGRVGALIKEAKIKSKRVTQDVLQDKSGSRKYAQRVLIFPNRTIGYRARHLMNDLLSLLPHSKKESKFNSRHNLREINEIADINNCNNCIFFEGRKNDRLFMWISKTPNGPSVRFRVHNVSTLNELDMFGNALKGARPLVIFDSKFNQMPHWRLIKVLLEHTFSTPRSSRKIKPFVDRIITFAIIDNKIWFRNYQILPETFKTLHRSPATVELPEKELFSEIGPRFVLEIVRILDQSFGGSTLYKGVGT